jgi:hypothetical protein
MFLKIITAPSGRRGLCPVILAVLLTAALAFTGCDTGGPNIPPPPYQWTAIPAATANSITGVAYGSSKFFAVGGIGTGAWGAYSPNGSSWTGVDIRTNLFNRDLSNVVFAGDRFLASTGSGNSPFVAYSLDGINSWTATSVGFGCKGLAYGNGTFVVGGQQGKMAYSPDGTNWTTLADTATTFNQGNGQQKYINAIVYGARRFVAGGGKGHAAYSADGVNWTGVAQTEVIFDDGFINGIAYGNGKFVAVGGLDAGPGKGAFSVDGVNWYQTGDIKIGADTKITGVAYGGGYFVAVDNKGAASYSSNGIVWTLVNDTTFGTDSIRGVAYGRGKFIIVGGGGQAAYANLYAGID